MRRCSGGAPRRESVPPSSTTDNLLHCFLAETVFLGNRATRANLSNMHSLLERGDQTATLASPALPRRAPLSSLGLYAHLALWAPLLAACARAGVPTTTRTHDDTYSLGSTALCLIRQDALLAAAALEVEREAHRAAQHHLKYKG